MRGPRTGGVSDLYARAVAPRVAKELGCTAIVENLAGLSLLRQDGRLSNVELAERVALSPTPCLRRVKRLEKVGVNAFYRAELDRRQLGLGVTASVCIQVHGDRHRWGG